MQPRALEGKLQFLQENETGTTDLFLYNALTNFNVSNLGPEKVDRLEILQERKDAAAVEACNKRTGRNIMSGTTTTMKARAIQKLRRATELGGESPSTSIRLDHLSCFLNEE